MTVLRYLSWWVLALFLFGMNGSRADTGKTIHIGVLAHRGKPQALARWQATANYLHERIQRPFDIVPLDLDEMSRAVATGSIDFVLTNPGNYVSLESEYGVSRILTLQTREKHQTLVRYGAVIICRADRDDIRNLYDLRQKSFMAVSPDAFGGFQMAWRELVEQGINPFTDFSSILFVGFPQDRIIQSVYDGEVDAATVRSETLVRLIEAGRFRYDDFRILNALALPGHPFPSSTRLYPEWPMATLKKTSRKLASEVTQELLSMKADNPAAIAAHTAGWTIPLDYSPVTELMQVLQIGPYDVLRQASLEYLIKRYLPWILSAAAGLVFMILLMGYISRTNQRLKETEHQLRDEIDQHEKARTQLAAYRDNLEEQVRERTEDLHVTNQALEKSRIALQELVSITSAPGLSHDNKIQRLLENGCAYYGLPVAVLASTQEKHGNICKISGDASLIPRIQGPLNQRCVSQILEQNGEPLDIPDIREVLGEDSECLRYGWRNYLGTTVMVEGKICCTLEFVGTHVRDKAYSKWDLEILKVMAQWIGDEIERQLAVEAQQRHQAELAHVSRMTSIGEMAASLAHELNQPLTGAINYSSACLRLLKEGRHSTEKLTEGMERAVEGANLAASIIRQIREFVQKSEVGFSRVDMNHVIHSVSKLISYEAKRQNVRIELQLDDEVAPVQGNMIQLEQVVLNLMRNAIDAMEQTDNRSRCIRITSEQDHDQVVIRVQDTGTGLAESEMHKIFDAFYTTKAEGMGIGLSISRSIVESHNGVIQVSSVPRDGCEFRIQLPALEACIA